MIDLPSIGIQREGYFEVLHHRLLRIVCFAVVILCSLVASAQSRDKAANKKIDKAINEHYLATEFDEAESTLSGTIEACEDRCSPALLGKAWMYIGVVRGAGKNDMAGAEEAFRAAFGVDPKVKLDDQLSTPELKKVFEKARKKPKKPEAAAAEEPAEEEAEAAEEPKPKKKKKKAEPVEEAEAEPEPKPKKAKKEPEPEAEATEEVPGGDVPIAEEAQEPAKAEPAAPAEKPAGSCEKSEDCAEGELCENGMCEEPPNCKVDADCGAGECRDGHCRMRHWVGLHFAQDIAIGGGKACALESTFTCYLAGTEDFYAGVPFEDGVAAPGIALATQRILLSYDIALIPNLTVGARAGLALGGGPPSFDGTGFMPVHAEVRGTFFFGSNPLSRRGFRPYVFGGGGLAQVDAKSSVSVQDCANYNMRPDADPAACVEGNRQVLTQADIDSLEVVQIDAYQKLGQGFAAVGGGVMYPLTSSIALQGNVGFMFMIPTFGVVIEPSLGIAVSL